MEGLINSVYNLRRVTEPPKRLKTNYIRLFWSLHISLSGKSDCLSKGDNCSASSSSILVWQSLSAGQGISSYCGSASTLASAFACVPCRLQTVGMEIVNVGVCCTAFAMLCICVFVFSILRHIFLILMLMINAKKNRKLFLLVHPTNQSINQSSKPGSFSHQSCQSSATC